MNMRLKVGVTTRMIRNIEATLHKESPTRFLGNTVPGQPPITDTITRKDDQLFKSRKMLIKARVIQIVRKYLVYIWQDTRESQMRNLTRTAVSQTLPLRG